MPAFNNYYDVLQAISAGVLVVYIIEAALKISTSCPGFSTYFKNGRNILDFSINSVVVNALRCELFHCCSTNKTIESDETL
ncbi:ion transporter [Candidatus Nitrosocosmicus franklandus]|uniref:ion transporter n=1 Tax=Candidatus Nitrosocosmicus franklandianus TaxID=1798806 RepID=UPI003CC8299F